MDCTDNFVANYFTPASGHNSFAYPKSVTSALGTVVTAYNYDTGLVK